MIAFMAGRTLWPDYGFAGHSRHQDAVHTSAHGQCCCDDAALNGCQLTDPNSDPPPVQVVEVVCCRPSELQRDLYKHFLRSNAAQRLLRAAEGQGKAKASALTAINALRKLCGHPRLIYDVLHPATGKAPAEADGFKVIAILEALGPMAQIYSSCMSAGS